MIAPGLLRRIGAALFIAAITVALCEIFARLALGIVQPTSALAMYEDNPVSGVRGLAVKPNLNLRWRTTEFDVAVRTNSHGYREDFEFDLADVEIAFMGDSFALGHGVEAEERYTTLFAARMKSRVAPGRIVSLSRNNGFAPEHYEYFLRKHPELRPSQLVVGLYLGNDLEPDVKETRFDRQNLTLELPYRSVEGGVMVSTVPYRVPLFRQLVSISSTARLAAILVNGSGLREYLYAGDAIVPNALNSSALEWGEFSAYSAQSFESLVNIRKMARQWGGRLVVMVIPQNFYAGAVKQPHLDPSLWPGIPEIVAKGGLRAAVMARCKALELNCIDVGGVMNADDFFPIDPHWNASGHRKAAEVLYDYLSGKEAR
jgi:hypothetical protein